MKTTARAARPRRRRRTTVYFTPEACKRLRLHCAEHDLEMSAFVEKAVARLLDLEPRGKR